MPLEMLPFPLIIQPEILAFRDPFALTSTFLGRPLLKQSFLHSHVNMKLIRLHGSNNYLRSWEFSWNSREGEGAVLKQGSLFRWSDWVGELGIGPLCHRQASGCVRSRRVGTQVCWLLCFSPGAVLSSRRGHVIAWCFISCYIYTTRMQHFWFEKILNIFYTSKIKI